MPGRIRVSVLESLEIPAELLENDNAALEVSVGNNVYHTKLDKKARGKLEASESQFEFPVLRFQDNVRVAILDSNGDAVSQTEIETPIIIESGLLDNLFPLKGGGNIHLKLCFVLSSEEYKQIQSLRETACKKKQSACFKWNPYLVTNEVAATKPISGRNENKDTSSKCDASNVKENKTEEAKTTEDKSEELEKSSLYIQIAQVSKELSNHGVERDNANFVLPQELGEKNDNKDIHRINLANIDKTNGVEEANSTEDKSEELKMSSGCIQSAQLSEKLSRHEVDKEMVNFGVLQEAENFPMFSAVDQNAEMLLIEDRSDIVLSPNQVEREILSETEVSAHKSYVCSNATKILGHECHSFHDSNILQELKSKDLPLFKNKRVAAEEYANSLSSVNIPCKKEDNFSTAFPLVPAERINIITDQVQRYSETNITSHVSVASASLSQPTVLQQENTSPSKRSSSGTNVEGQLNNVLEVQELKKQKSRSFDNLRKIYVANQLPSVSLETEKVKSNSTSFKNSTILPNTLQTPSASFHCLVNSQAYKLTACPQKLTDSESQEMKRNIDLRGNVKEKIMAFEGGLPQRGKKIFLYNNVKAKIKAFESTLSQEPGQQRNYAEKFEHKTVNRNVSKQPTQVIVTEYKGNLRQGNVRNNKSCQLTESKSDVHKRLKRTNANTQVTEDMKENEMGTIFKDIIISKDNPRRDDILTANEQANPIALKKHTEVADGCQKGLTISMKHMQIKDKCHLEEFDATKDEIIDFENEQAKPGETRLHELKRIWHDKAMNLNSATDTVSMNNESRQCTSTNIIETQHASQWGHNLKQTAKLSKAEEAELQTVQALGAGINFTDCTEQMENAEETIESLKMKRIENNNQVRGRSVAREQLSSQMSPGLTVSVDVTKSNKDPQKVSKNNTKASGGIVKQGLAATVVLAVGTVFVWARGQKMSRQY